MHGQEETRELILEHYKEYPLLEIQDLFKFLFHSAYGCEHMISSLEVAIERTLSEYKRLKTVNTKLKTVDQLDGDYVRIHLSSLSSEEDAKNLGRLFFLSARSESRGEEKLREKLCVARKMIQSGELHFSIDDYDKAVKEWERLGFSALHHSELFREKYVPSYRVIAKEYLSEITHLHLE